MPQDGSKSSVYRSFFSCDDPKGVAEYKTIRKSKTESQRSEDQKKQKSLDMSLSYNPPKNEKFLRFPTDKPDDPSSIKLEEITRGAQKLNQVIDTCSNKTNFDRQSKDIAKDLLKGALDLQESLEMLGKLQEASNYMAKWKRKQKEKSVGGKLDVASIERASSDHFGSRTEFQRPRLSVDGSSKDCYEELREAIIEGLAKQNLLPKSSIEVNKAYIDRNKNFDEEKPYFDRVEVPKREKAYFERSKSFSETNSHFGRRKLELSLDFPSTSSSQTSMCHSHEFDSTDTSFSRSFEENSQGPNVVAKLMGLEENIPKTWQPNVQMQLRKEKGLNYGRPIFSMDFPKARSSHFSSVQKVESRQRTFEELIQTVQYKGPVSGKSIGISGTQKQLPMVYDKKKRLAEDGPPIVIIKPHQFPCYDPKEIIRKLKMKEVVSGRTSNVKKSALNISEIQRSLQAQISPQRLSHDKGDAKYWDAYARTNYTGTNGQEELQSNRTKASVSWNPKLQKKEVIHEKVDKVHRLAPNSKTAKEVDTAKLRDVPRICTTDQTTSTSSRKPHRVSDSSKYQIAQKKAASKLSEASTPEAPYSSTKKKKKTENGVSTPPSTRLVKTQLEDDAIQINQNPETEHDLSVTKLVISEKLACKTEDDFAPSLDGFNMNESHLSGYTTQLIEHESETKSSGNSTCCITNDPIAKRSCNEEATKVTRNLLLNSALFLDKLEDMFHTSANQPVVSHTNSSPDNKMSDPKDLLDTAKELLEYKDLQSTQGVQPWSHTLTKTSRAFIDQLVGEICEGIEDLRSYHNLTSEQAAGDSLDKVLDKDLWCKGVVSGGWDFGWRSGFTRNEVEQIVIDIEQEILSVITEEALEHMLS